MSFTKQDIQILQQLFEQQHRKFEKNIVAVQKQNHGLGKDIKVLQKQYLGLSDELVAFEDRLSEKISHLPTKEEFFTIANSYSTLALP